MLAWSGCRRDGGTCEKGTKAVCVGLRVTRLESGKRALENVGLASVLMSLTIAESAPYPELEFSTQRLSLRKGSRVLLGSLKSRKLLAYLAEFFGLSKSHSCVLQLPIMAANKQGKMVSSSIFVCLMAIANIPSL